jgi:cysteine synthase A
MDMRYFSKLCGAGGADHFVNIARRRAAQEEGAIFSDQFENLANARVHLKTGEEIWDATQGRVNAFVSGDPI